MMLKSCMLATVVIVLALAPIISASNFNPDDLVDNNFKISNKKTNQKSKNIKIESCESPTNRIPVSKGLLNNKNIKENPIPNNTNYQNLVPINNNHHDYISNDNNHYNPGLNRNENYQEPVPRDENYKVFSLDNNENHRDFNDELFGGEFMLNNGKLSRDLTLNGDEIYDNFALSNDDELQNFATSNTDGQIFMINNNGIYPNFTLGNNNNQNFIPYNENNQNYIINNNNQNYIMDNNNNQNYIINNQNYIINNQNYIINNQNHIINNQNSTPNNNSHQENPSFKNQNLSNLAKGDFPAWNDFAGKANDIYDRYRKYLVLHKARTGALKTLKTQKSELFVAGGHWNKTTMKHYLKWIEKIKTSAFQKPTIPQNDANGLVNKLNEPVIRVKKENDLNNPETQNDILSDEMTSIMLGLVQVSTEVAMADANILHEKRAALLGRNILDLGKETEAKLAELSKKTLNPSEALRQIMDSSLNEIKTYIGGANLKVEKFLKMHAQRVKEQKKKIKDLEKERFELEKQLLDCI